jgi:hypothetical protein
MSHFSVQDSVVLVAHTGQGFNTSIGTDSGIGPNCTLSDVCPSESIIPLPPP